MLTLEHTLTNQIFNQLTKPIEEEAVGAVEYIDLLEWVQRYRKFLIPDRLFDLENHQHLRQIYQDQSRVVVIYKAAQMGASELAISKGFHGCDVRGANVLYVFPTQTHVSEFSAGRIGPAIEPSASEYLASIVGDSSGGKKSADRVGLKRVRNRFLYLRGAQVKPDGRASQLKSVDADIIIMDEIDEMDQRAIPIAEKRTGHSSIKEELWLSTPTFHEFGIHKKWLETDQKQWFISCSSCGKKQPLHIDKCITERDALERPVNWHGYPNNAFMVCDKCGKELNRLGNGEWVASKPDVEISGYHLTKLFSSQMQMIDIVKSLITTNETKKKEAINQNLGEPFIPKGGKITDDVLNGCKQNYASGPKQGEKCYMGVDVGRVLHVVIRGERDAETGNRPLRFAGIVDDFPRLKGLIKQYSVKICVVDALPETRSARQFQKGLRGKVYLCYYATNKEGTKHIDEIQWVHREGNVLADRTRSLDKTFERFYEAENILPADIENVHDYYKQLKAPVRVIEERSGKEVAVYVESGEDHFAHAENYCTIASEGYNLGGWSRGRSA